MLCFVVVVVVVVVAAAAAVVVWLLDSDEIKRQTARYSPSLFLEVLRAAIVLHVYCGHHWIMGRAASSSSIASIKTPVALTKAAVL